MLACLADTYSAYSAYMPHPQPPNFVQSNAPAAQQPGPMPPGHARQHMWVPDAKPLVLWVHQDWCLLCAAQMETLVFGTLPLAAAPPSVRFRHVMSLQLKVPKLHVIKLHKPVCCTAMFQGASHNQERRNIGSGSNLLQCMQFFSIRLQLSGQGETISVDRDIPSSTSPSQSCLPALI